MKIFKCLLFFALLLTAYNSYSQHTVGIRGGYSGGSTRMIPVSDKGTLWGLPSFGVTYQYTGGEAYLGAIEASLLYSQRGYKTFPRIDSDTSYQRRINTIELPFMWHPYVDMFKNRVTLFLNAGPYLAYYLSSSYENVSKEKGVLSSGDYEWDALRDNRLEYGLQGGGGISVRVGKSVDIVGEFRYVWGLSDVLKNITKYPTNPTESPLNNMTVMVGLNYTFGLGDKAKERKQKREAARSSAMLVPLDDALIQQSDSLMNVNNVEIKEIE